MKFRDKYPYYITLKGNQDDVILRTNSKIRFKNELKKLDKQDKYTVKVSYSNADPSNFSKTDTPTNERTISSKKESAEAVFEFTEPNLLRYIYD